MTDDELLAAYKILVASEFRLTISEYAKVYHMVRKGLRSDIELLNAVQSGDINLEIVNYGSRESRCVEMDVSMWVPEEVAKRADRLFNLSVARAVYD